MKKLNHHFNHLLLFFLVFSPSIFVAADSPDKVETWHLHLEHEQEGAMNMLMEFHFVEYGFIAKSREKALQELLGAFKARQTMLVSGDFQEGMLFQIPNAKFINPLSKKFNAQFKTPFGEFFIMGAFKNDSLIAKVMDKHTRIKGSLIGTPYLEDKPLKNYDVLVNQFVDSLNYYFIKEDLKNPKHYDKFTKKLKDAAPKLNDDAELFFLFKALKEQYHLEALDLSIPFTDTAVLKDNFDVDLVSPFSAYDLNFESLYLYVQRFDVDTTVVDSMMDYLGKKNYRNLIIDLSGLNAQNVVTAKRIFDRLSDSAFFLGCYVNAEWLRAKDTFPETSEMLKSEHDVFGCYNAFEEQYLPLFSQALKKEAYAPNDSTPLNIFVISGEETSGTPEVLSLWLRDFLGAQLVGLPTAGMVMWNKNFDIDNFRLSFPYATFQSSSGKRIDQEGLMPTHKVPTSQAKTYIKQHLLFTD